MVLPRGHMWVVMGGPEVRFGALRGELEIGPKISPRWAPLGPPAASISHGFPYYFWSRFVKEKLGAAR